MIAIIKWKEGSPNKLPNKAEIPIGIELKLKDRNYRGGVIIHWLESTYHWGIDSINFEDEITGIGTF